MEKIGMLVGFFLFNSLHTATFRAKSFQLNYFASNLRHLRKAHRMSQQEFADQLNVKRSNVAAYETKNVEPRLALLMEIAKVFSVSVGELITADLRNVPLGQQSLPEHFSALKTQFQELANKNTEIESMVQGFQLFFEFKQKELQRNPDGLQHANSNDIDNFLIFLSHMRTYNQSVSTLTDVLVKMGGAPVESH